MKKILIINGPNLNLLGNREPVLYGNQSFAEVLEKIKTEFPNLSISYFQSNQESEIIDVLHNASANGTGGVVLNAAAFSHTSLAIADAVAAIETPVIEVHITNIFAREVFRQKSYVSKFAKGVIAGLGTDVYWLAVKYLERIIE